MPRADTATVEAELDEAERRALRRKSRAATLEALTHLGSEARREAIRERALAVGGFTPRELGALRPDAGNGTPIRVVDHALSWALTNLKRDGLVHNPRWSVWALAGVALEAPAPAVDGPPTSPERLIALRSMSYREYLRSPEWRRTRAAAIARAGGRCSLEATHTEDLEVHHNTYERRGAELAADLTVLCKSCHRVHHKANGRPQRMSTPPPALRTERILSGGSGDRRPSLLRRMLRG